MKKHLFVLVFITIAVFCFAQAFDDMAYSNPEYMAYFQQEMTSLIQFQFDNDINIPLFASASLKVLQYTYTEEYLDFMFADSSNWDSPFSDKPYGYNGRTNFELQFLFGAQFKTRRSWRIPVIVGFGITALQAYSEDEWQYLDENGKRVFDVVTDYKEPLWVEDYQINGLVASGFYIDTDILKGGLFFGLSDVNNNEAEFTRSFKIAFVPMVNTSSWNYTGKVLDSFIAYVGIGSAVSGLMAEDSDANSFMNSLNASLDLKFNMIYLHPLSLQTNIIYYRGSYDTAAKNDTFGLKVQWLMSDFPLGLSLEGGYRRFFYVFEPLRSEYFNTPYINGSFYFPLRPLTFGMIYQYDNVSKSKYIIALSNNFISGFFTHNPLNRFIDKNKYDDVLNASMGVRYRHGGWRAEGGKPPEYH